MLCLLIAGSDTLHSEIWVSRNQLQRLETLRLIKDVMTSFGAPCLSSLCASAFQGDRAWIVGTP